MQKNFAYVLGEGEGSARKRTTYFESTEPKYFDRYEVYVDVRESSDNASASDYINSLKQAGAEKLVPPQTASESMIAALSTQYEYNKDYFVGDYVTVEHKQFGLINEKIQLVGMIESFDLNGRNLTPTFREV